jgi:Flp pilus assembly protein TadD
VRFAQLARAATRGRDDSALDTLAAALAEAGSFEEAVRTIDEALALVSDPERRAKLTARRELYQAGKPFRSTP